MDDDRPVARVPVDLPAADGSPAEPLALGVGLSHHSPVEELLGRAGATFVDHDGTIIAADFGSVAGELAICVRAVGLADRADLGVLQLSGHPGTVAGLAERLSGRPPAAGTATRTATAWWCPVGGRILILCEPGRRAALVRELEAAARRASGVACHDLSDEHAAVSVVGPRARRLLEAVAPAGGVPEADGGCASGELAGSPVTLLRESENQYLLVMARGDEPGDWQVLREAGQALGVAFVGREALEHYAIRERLAHRHRPA